MWEFRISDGRSAVLIDFFQVFVFCAFATRSCKNAFFSMPVCSSLHVTIWEALNEFSWNLILGSLQLSIHTKLYWIRSHNNNWHFTLRLAYVSACISIVTLQIYWNWESFEQLMKENRNIFSYIYSFSFHGFHDFRDGFPRLAIPQLCGHWTDIGIAYPRSLSYNNRRNGLELLLLLFDN
jgi:hypothetical protein